MGKSLKFINILELKLEDNYALSPTCLDITVITEIYGCVRYTVTKLWLLQ